MNNVFQLKNNEIMIEITEKIARMNNDEHKLMDFCVLNLFSLFGKDPLKYDFDFRFRIK